MLTLLHYLCINTGGTGLASFKISILHFCETFLFLRAFATWGSVLSWWWDSRGADGCDSHRCALLRLHFLLMALQQLRGAVLWRKALWSQALVLGPARSGAWSPLSCSEIQLTGCAGTLLLCGNLYFKLKVKCAVEFGIFTSSDKSLNGVWQVCTSQRCNTVRSVVCCLCSICSPLTFLSLQASSSGTSLLPLVTSSTSKAKELETLHPK